MIIYLIFQYILILWAAIIIGYPFVLSILAIFHKNKKILQNTFNHSFLILVHSHNQGKEISKTLYSLVGLVYPWNMYDLMVVADRCTDDTVKISKKLGARVVEYTSSDGSEVTNGLQWFLKQENLYDKYDAVVFIGPNDLISGNFLEVMNQYLREGSKILQSANRKVSNLTTWKIKYQRVCWLLRTYIDALGRKKIGLGTILLKSGMCFKTEILKNNLIKFTHSNFGYSMFLPDNQSQVDFAPEASIWSPVYDDSSEEAKLDQRNWMNRQFCKVKKYLKRFTIYFNNKTLLQKFDTLIWMITLSLMLMLIGVVANCIINLILWKLGYVSACLWVIWMVLLGMLITYLSIGLMIGLFSRVEP